MPAIASHSSSTTNSPWDAGANVGRIKTPVTSAVAGKMWAWREAGDWPEAKSGYKFPHHMVSGDGTPGAANTNACSAIIAILNGGRGGSSIPGADRQGVYNHAANHLKAAGKEVPPLGADPGETEAWAQALEAESAESGCCEACAGHPDPAVTAKTSAGAADRGDFDRDRELAERLQPDLLLPPLVPLGQSVWAMLPGALRRVLTANSSVVNNEVVAAAQKIAQTQIEDADNGKVAVVPLTGVITPRGSLLSLLFGGGVGGLAAFRAEFGAAVNDPEVAAIVLNVDSPGGLVTMVPETAAMMREARGSKPIVAQVNTLAASAAYWLASQADEIVMTPSGSAGSIGVYMVHEDWSAADEKAGVDPTFIYAGKYKIEGNRSEPLSDEGKAFWQSEADDIYAMFVSDVAAGREVPESKVTGGYGEGRTLLGERALQAGVVDRLDTLQATVGRLLGDATPVPEPTAAAADQRRLAALLFG